MGIFASGVSGYSPCGGETLARFLETWACCSYTLSGIGRREQEQDSDLLLSCPLPLLAYFSARLQDPKGLHTPKQHHHLDTKC